MDVKNKVIVITGGGGALCGAIARGIAKGGAQICLLGRTISKLELVRTQITSDNGIAKSYSCDVLDEIKVEKTMNQIINDFGKIDGLINGAGGNQRGATILPSANFSDISSEDLDAVLKLNIQGTMIPSKVVSEHMAEQKSGSIINISSMAATTPLTRVVGYSSAKAAVNNFTKWLSVELATKYGEGIRVNAIAPGFFLADQNRALLIDESGNYTARAKTIIEHTPFRRFGKPEELIGICQFLMSDSSKFITGTIIPVDGGFSAFSGV